LPIFMPIKNFCPPNAHFLNNWIQEENYPNLKKNSKNLAFSAIIYMNNFLLKLPKFEIYVRAPLCIQLKYMYWDIFNILFIELGRPFNIWLRRDSQTAEVFALFQKA
jgi:hypothetical protein